MEYLFDLSVAEAEFYRLDENDELSPKLLACFQEIITIVVNNYTNHRFCLPQKFSVKPISEQDEGKICRFINDCLAINSVLSIKYSKESTDITIG